MMTEALLLPFPSFPRFSAGETGKISKWVQFKSSISLTCSLTSRNFSRLSSLSTQNGGFRGGVGDGDGVIIVYHGSRRKESNIMLNEFVEMCKRKTGYEIVEPAHMELAEPSIGDAFESYVKQGARRIIVSPFFLFSGRHWHQAAKEHLGVSYIITAPLGLHELLVVLSEELELKVQREVMNDRIKHCLSHVDGAANECAVCAGTGKCRIY